MDRSEIPELTAAKFPRSGARFFFLLTLTLLFAPPLFFSSSAFGTTDTAPKVTATGLYFGYIVDLQPDGISLTVMPIDRKLPRQRFYLDNQTLFRVDGKRATFHDLYRNDKVAIRFFAEGRVAVADEVFVVFGEFKNEDYVSARKKKKGKGK